MRWLIEWWCGLPKWIRYAAPAAVLGATGILILCGYVWPAGFVIGFILLLCADLPDRF